MYDQVMDNYRKAAETTLQFQQEFYRQWTQQMSQAPGMAAPGSAMGANWIEQLNAFRKKWNESITDVLNKHRESLDAQYRAGIRTIEDAFRVGDAKDPEQFRKLIEELWRQGFECMKTLSESQIRDSQAAMEKWFDTVAKAAAASPAPGARS